MNIDPEEFNEHAIASGTAGLAKHRQALPVEQPETFHVEAGRTYEVRGRAFGRTQPDPESCTDVPAREVGIQAAPVAYTPPKYGPPPGVNPMKWKGMSRSARRAHLRDLARTINKLARQPEGD